LFHGLHSGMRLGRAGQDHRTKRVSHHCTWKRRQKGVETSIDKFGPSPCLLRRPRNVGRASRCLDRGERYSSWSARSIRSSGMPIAKAATRNAMSAAGGRSRYLPVVRKRSRDTYDDLISMRGELKPGNISLPALVCVVRTVARFAARTPRPLELLPARA
jgi:hypothetical protein